MVDPRRDIDVYRGVAAKNGMEITAATETHIHADHLPGTREVAAATGATIHVSGEGGKDWQYEFEAERLHGGEEIRIGNVVVAAAHTPGHTPRQGPGRDPVHHGGLRAALLLVGPYLAADDEEGFVKELLEDQPDTPFYFGRMKNQNHQGPAIMGSGTPST